MKEAAIIACHECDLLQREGPLPQGGKALCVRCGALLYRSHPRSVERTLAFALAAIVLFAVANSFPIVSLELQGQRVDATLYGAVNALYGQGTGAPRTLSRNRYQNLLIHTLRDGLTMMRSIAGTRLAA